jgi:hypothetical protein
VIRVGRLVVVLVQPMILLDIIVGQLLKLWKLKDLTLGIHI